MRGLVVATLALGCGVGAELGSELGTAVGCGAGSGGGCGLSLAPAASHQPPPANRHFPSAKAHYAATNDHPPWPRGECDFENLTWSASSTGGSTLGALGALGEESGDRAHGPLVVPGLTLPTIDRGIVYNESG